jgi:predicted amidohydrolase
MFDHITAAAISFVPRKWDVAYNLVRLTGLVRQAAAAIEPHANLILAPEGILEVRGRRRLRAEVLGAGITPAQHFSACREFQCVAVDFSRE